MAHATTGQLAAALGMIAIGSLLAACDVRGRVYEDRPAYYAERPVYVTPPPQGPIIIREAPPPPRRENRPRRPGPGFVWVPGYYVVRGNHWEWAGGHWERPPRPGAVWVEPRYQRHGDAYDFSFGFWR
jgi:hypothetical protein